MKEPLKDRIDLRARGEIQQVHIELEKTLYEGLRARCKELHCPVYVILEELIREYLDEDKRDTPTPPVPGD